MGYQATLRFLKDFICPFEMHPKKGKHKLRYSKSNLYKGKFKKSVLHNFVF
jgi:hypothetical protein